MPKLEHFCVYNVVTGQIYITKGKRPAERIASTANKLCRLINLQNQNVCEECSDFFKSHHIEKEKIHFTWDISSEERMVLLRNFFKVKEYL